MTTLNPPQSIVIAINNINTTETLLDKALIGSAQAGDTYIIEGFGTCVSTAGNLSTFTVYLGTTGTINDAPIGMVPSVGGASTTNVGFYFRIMVTFRTVGSSGTVLVNGIISQTDITGGITNTINAVSANYAVPTVATNVANYLSVSYKSAAVTTTSSFQNISIYRVK